MSTHLTLSHYRFDVVARTPVKLGGLQAGDRLRNALAAVMLRTVCSEGPRRTRLTQEHARTCPVCWLLAADVDPGDVRRAYSLVAPYRQMDVAQAGERFSFVLTLYGEGSGFLPYFLLAVPEMGETGVGPGRGQFNLEAISAMNPLTGEHGAVLLPGEETVQVPEVVVRWHDVKQTALKVQEQIGERGALRLHFVTPMRLISNDVLVKTPDFGVLFQRLLHRIDQLGQLYEGEEKRVPEETEYLLRLANAVRLIDARTEWVELWSWSGRTQKKSPMSGYMGVADYRSGHWDTLLPWLILGQGTQVGKVTVKGNGVFEVNRIARNYWQWLYTNRAVEPL